MNNSKNGNGKSLVSVSNTPFNSQHLPKLKTPDSSKTNTTNKSPRNNNNNDKKPQQQPATNAAPKKTTKIKSYEEFR